MMDDQELTLTLNSPFTDEDWDLITDADFDYTSSITFKTKHGKTVEFIKRERGKWIPMSEKLPEEKGRYIVYCTLTGIDRSIRTAMYYPGGWLEWDVDGARGIARVVAWMPLPEPYEEGK